MYAYLISPKIPPVRSCQSLLVFDFDTKIEPELIQKGENMTPAHLLKNDSDLYAYYFWKVCHPVLLLKTVRLLETFE